MAKDKLQIRLTYPPAPADLANEEEHRRTVRDLAAMYAAIEAQPPRNASGYMRALMLAGWRAIQFVGPGPPKRVPVAPPRATVPAPAGRDKFEDDLG